MAQKQEFTVEELHKMNKPEIIKLAESLHIKTHNLSKLQINQFWVFHLQSQLSLSS